VPPGHANGLFSNSMSSRPLPCAIGLACAIFFLGLALYHAPLAAVGAILLRTDPIWLGVALGVYAVNLSLRAWRWQLILRSVADLRYPIVARVLLVGYGLNTIMPARLGEFFRAEFLCKSCGLPRAPVLTSIVVERLLDGLAVVLCLALGLLLASRGGRAAAGLTAAMAVGGTVFGGVLIAALGCSRLRPSRLLARFPRWSEPMAAVERGLAILYRRRGLYAAILTLVIYAPEALSLWLVVKAVGFDLGFADTLVLIGAASLGTLLPSGPAFLGTLQLAYVLAIEFAGGRAATGIAAATLAQFFILLPVAAAATGVLLHGSGNPIFRAAAHRIERSLDHLSGPIGRAPTAVGQANE
jgi:uncharacterized membrane protein YbhN (UPF0104 family)